MSDISGDEHGSVQSRHSGTEPGRLSIPMSEHRCAIESSANAMIITRAEPPHFIIEYVNPAFERITGYRAAEVIGRSATLVLPRRHDTCPMVSLRTQLLPFHRAWRVARWSERIGGIAATHAAAAVCRGGDQTDVPVAGGMRRDLPAAGQPRGSADAARIRVHRHEYHVFPTAARRKLPGRAARLDQPDHPVVREGVDRTIAASARSPWRPPWP